MKPEHVKTAALARAIVAERGLQHVKVGVFDNDGILRGKYMGREKFFGVLDKGFGFCDVVLGWDSNDQLYDNVTYTGWHTASPDAPVRVLPPTCRDVPLEGDMLFFLGEFAKVQWAAEQAEPEVNPLELPAGPSVWLSELAEEAALFPTSPPGWLPVGLAQGSAWGSALQHLHPKTVLQSLQSALA